MTFGLASVPLFPQGQVLGDRLNQLDLRLGKILRFGRDENAVNLDVYNAFNSNAVLAENSTYSNASLGRLARADHHRHRPVRQDQRAVRLLTASIGSGP